MFVKLGRLGGSCDAREACDTMFVILGRLGGSCDAREACDTMFVIFSFMGFIESLCLMTFICD